MGSEIPDLPTNVFILLLVLLVVGMILTLLVAIGVYMLLQHLRDKGVIVAERADQAVGGGTEGIA